MFATLILAAQLYLTLPRETWIKHVEAIAGTTPLKPGCMCTVDSITAGYGILESYWYITLSGSQTQIDCAKQNLGYPPDQDKQDK